MMKTQTTQIDADFQMATEALAGNLSSSEPIVAYQNARASLDNDRQAQALLQQLAQIQSEIRAGQARGAVTQAEIERLRAIRREVQSNPTIDNFSLTQQAAVTYLREINQEISQLLGFDFAALARPAGGCC